MRRYMITIEELKALNAEILAEARKELGLVPESQVRLEEVVRLCRAHIAKNEALKRRLPRDSQYQLRCQNIDARTMPLRDILKAAGE